jgi:tetratricopeptide (TPR) repeat protein
LIREVDPAGTDFAFSHQLIQQTVYGGLYPEARQRRHRRIGNVIEELYSDQREQFAAELASHFDRGGENERAAEYYCLAARHALTLYGSEEARTLASRARELTLYAATRFRANEISEEASRRLADRASQRDSIAQLLALAREIGDPELLREALRRQIVLAHDCAEREQQRDAIAELEGLLDDADASWHSIFAQLKGTYLTAIGSYREAREVMADALGAISARDNPRVYVECRCALVELAGFEGRVADVRAFLDEVPTFEGAYDVTQVITLLETACAAAMKIQDNTALAACADRLLQSSATIGYRQGEAAAYGFAGRAALRLFDIDGARRNLHRAMEMFASMGQRLKQVWTLGDIAGMSATIGRFDEAIEQFKSADDIALSISYGFGHVGCLNNISYVANLKGDFELALSSAREALAVAEGIEAPSGRAHALVNVGVAERELHRIDAAIAHLDEGTALERELNETVELGEDLCELIIALLHNENLERAQQLAVEVLDLVENTAPRLIYPQFLLWTVAAVRRASGDEQGASILLTRARRTLDEREAAIPDSESRVTFRHLRFNRAIDEAFEQNRWMLVERTT